MSANEPALAELFEQLLAQDGAARESLLASLPTTTAAQLRALLAADAQPDTLIGEAIGIGFEEDPLPDPAGTRIGRWRVIGELGTGGMGTVLLAERGGADFSQQVAIKLIRGYASGEGIRRLRQERQILAALDHPAIARLIDGGETDSGQPYLVMEYVAGQTLAAWLKSGQAGRETALALFEQICAAVQHAHQHLVIHRDLKPANVMIRADGSVKLLDFGVAKLLDIGESAADTQSTRVYTAGYASPEQQSGRPISIASDVYSLGVMLREMLAATRAEAGRGRADPELDGIVNKATAEDPAQRYVTVAALADDLCRYRRGQPVLAAANTRRYRLRKWIGRHRLASAMTVLAVLTIAVLIAYLAGALASAEHEREQAEQARVEAEQSLARARAVIGFFADMFEGVAPEHALGRKLAPAELLARAERQLAEHPPADQGLRADLSAALGSLYQRMGDGEAAVRQFEASLAGQTVSDRESAIELADRHSQLALVLADLDRNEDALAEIERANALRQPYANSDPALALLIIIERTRGLVAMRRNDDAALALQQAHDLIATQGADPRSQQEMHRLEATLANDQGRFDEARAAAAAGLVLLTQHPELPQTLGIELERMQAMAARGQGRLLDAEAAFGRAIALHQRWVGDTGTRAYGLHNDHAIVLATLGHYRAAIAAYQHAGELFAAAGGPAIAANPRHWNNICDSELGLGDYPAALAHCQQSAAILIAERPAKDPDRLQVESNLARATALAGHPDQALRSYTSVIARSAESIGADSFPVALHSWRAARAALMLGNRVAARRWGEKAEQIFLASFQSPHLWRARGLRMLAQVDLAEQLPEAAEKRLAQALLEIGDSLPAAHPLIAQINTDRAQAAFDRGDLTRARTLLAAALPVLRQCCLETEIDRTAAERLAMRLAAMGAAGQAR
ncbi:MAG: protein kinase [Lysobacterales bacterium]